MQGVDLLLGAAFVALVLGQGAIVWWATRPRQRNVELEGQLDELTVLVERLAKATRRERMQRVRAAAKDGETDSAPPELQQDAPPAFPVSLHDRKAALRRHFYRR